MYGSESMLTDNASFRNNYRSSTQWPHTLRILGVLFPYTARIVRILRSRSKRCNYSDVPWVSIDLR